MPFLTALIAKDRRNGRWELAQDLVYEGHTDRFVVPSGFLTDFASVPRIVQSIAPKMGKQNRAAVLHDWCYQHAPLLLRESGYVPITRRDADRIFRRVMREEGVNIVRRNVFFFAVRIGGWLPWAKARRG